MADGSGFEPCNCSATGSGGSGNGSGGTSSAGAAGNGMGGNGTNEPAEFTGATGLRCETDADCFGGLTCSPSTAADNPYGVGGVQRGLCTRTCTADQAGSDSCTLVDSFSDCIVFQGDPTGYCLPLCAVEQSSPQRCAGRVDLACVPSEVLDPTLQVGLCFPQCSSDADCEGRSCDPATGLCVDTLPTRGPGVIGAACNLATEGTDCLSGVCLDVEEDGSGFCTASCVLGSVGGCGFAQAASPREASCFGPGTSLPGDRGFCLELCDVQADCAQPGYECEPNPGAAQALGRSGQCLPPLGGIDAGADGG